MQRKTILSLFLYLSLSLSSSLSLALLKNYNRYPKPYVFGYNFFQGKCRYIKSLGLLQYAVYISM